MTDLKKTITKGSLGTVAAGAMALATFAVSATPAMADDRHRDRDGIGAGEIIAGAVIIGGIAALAGAFDGDKDRYYNDRYYNDRHYNDRRYNNSYNYRSRGNAQAAIERCVYAAENQARRAGYRYANVTQIRDVDRERRGFEVEGRIEVAGARGYDRGYGYGYSKRGRVDTGRFKCDLRYGRVTDIDFKGIRGLR